MISSPLTADMATAELPKDSVFEIALLSDIGTNRDNNEDSCGHYVESPESVMFAVADGMGGYEGGEVASAMAIAVTIETYRESPPAWERVANLNRTIA